MIASIANDGLENYGGRGEGLFAESRAQVNHVVEFYATKQGIN